jgi:pimeloyl-ACP methyl ester carboxylesterase
MKIVKRLTLLLVIVAISAAAIFYTRPLWVNDQILHYKMWRAGIHSHEVNLPEGRIRYFEEPATTDGPGIPLLIIHGLGGRGEDFAGLIPRFAAQGFHVYAPDLLGYGASDKPSPSDFSITTEEHVVLNFMDAMHLPHASIIGWSMGGWIVLKLALDAPQRVDRLVVYDSAGLIFQSTVDADLFAPSDQAGVARLFHTLSPTVKVPPPFAQRDIIRRNGERKWIIARSLAAMRTGKDVLDFRLAQMKPPLLIVWGTADILTPPDLGQKMHQLDPRSVYATVEGCGHFAPVECATPVAKVTLNFLKSDPPMQSQELSLPRIIH